MRVAEARLAIEYLQRAEDLAAGVDENICADIVRIHQRLLRWIASSHGEAQLAAGFAMKSKREGAA
jgi:hypothetical protein